MSGSPTSTAERADQEDLGAHVIRIIAKTQRIPVDTIALDSTFEELKIDSLDGINIVFAIENEFSITIPDDAVRNLRSVRETMDGVQRLLLEKSPVPAPPSAV